MAKVFYSMAGEGRGHATRVKALVEALRGEHQLTLFAPGDAFDMLSGAYCDNEVRVVRIPGLHFRYRAHSVDYWGTTKVTLQYLWNLPRLLRWLENLLRRERPDLVVTDFEPALPRAAKRCGIPFVSFDHQHFLTVSDLSSLPKYLKYRAMALGAAVRSYYGGQRQTIVSSFYHPPLKREFQNVVQVGVLLRPEIVGARSERGEHLVMYFRKSVPDSVLEVLSRCGRPVKVYGLGPRSSVGNLHFRPISERGFMTDLASCTAVVSTAGNQLVGESLYLGKPVLAMPEDGNFEQFINAHFLQQSGAGTWTEMRHFSSRILHDFLARIDEFVARIQPEQLHGNPRALAAIRRYLPNPVPAAMKPSLAV